MLRKQAQTRNEEIDEELERECVTLLIHGAMISAVEEQSFVTRVRCTSHLPQSASFNICLTAALSHTLHVP